MKIYCLVLILLSVCCFEENHSREYSAALSITKGGNIRIGECYADEDLFQSPYLSDWSCEDATTYTWRHDFDNELVGIAPSDRERLTASAGYCPHRRCQLSNASASDSSEQCPSGKVHIRQVLSVYSCFIAYFIQDFALPR